MEVPKLQIIICLIIILFLAGCDASHSPSTPEPKPLTTSEIETDLVVLYYKKGDYLVPVSLKCAKDQDFPNTVVDILLSGGVPEGFHNPLAGVTLRGLSSDGGTVAVDLSKEFLEGDTKAKKDQLIYTLMTCDHVDKADLFVEGNILSNILETPKDINFQQPLSMDGEPEDFIETDNLLTLYYVDQDRYLVPVTLMSEKIPPTPMPSDKAKAALEHLAQGPQELEGLVDIFPHKAKADVDVKENIAQVDIDSKLLVNIAKDMEEAKLALETILLTLTSIDGVDKVQFHIGGRRFGYIVDGMDISNPLPRPKYFNQLQ